MSDDEQFDAEPADEVLTPDEVSGPRTVRRMSAGQALPDRFARYSMYTGIASLALLVVFPVLIVILMLACAALYLGFRVRKDLAAAEEPDRARKRARIGTITGGLTLIGLLTIFLYITVFYETPDKAGELPEATAEPG